MNFAFFYLSLIWTFWFIRQEKIVFFYIYLWQLKEYHWGRFIDHFRTEKGRRLIFHPLNIAKFAIFLSYWPATAYFKITFIWSSLIFAVYGLEFLIILRDLNNRTFKKPVLTLKTKFLTIVISLILLAVLIYTFLVEIVLTGFTAGLPLSPIFVLLLIDVLSPIIISAFVLILQPLSLIYQLIIVAKAKKKRLRFKKLVVIGITGSYGKTSTKELLFHILSEKFNVLKTTDHQNSEIGIAHCILNNLKPEHQVFVCEMGAYNKGKISQVANMAQPKISLITGVNQQHLALFGSMKNLISAEGGKELLKSLPEEGIGIFNYDNRIIKELRPEIEKENPKIKTLFCSTTTDIKNIKVNKDWLSFNIDATEFRVNLIGKQNIENLLLAITAAKKLGMTTEKISTALEKIKPGTGSMKIVKGSQQTDIIDSTYSANPDGVLASLEHLKIWPDKKIVIMPSLIELGAASKQIHYEIGKKIGKICDLAIIVTKDRFKELQKGAISVGLKPEQIIFSENPKQIAEKLKGFYGPNNVILLEGRLPKILLNLILK